MADIQSAIAEIRRGKKKKKKKNNKRQDENIYGLPCYIGQAINQCLAYIISLTVTSIAESIMTISNYL